MLVFPVSIESPPPPSSQMAQGEENKQVKGLCHFLATATFPSF